MEFKGPNRAGPGRSSRNGPGRRNHKETTTMTDLIFIGVIVAFFIVAGLYAAFCEKL
jgi:hypothetical protein